jgi:hypothetical protein
MDQQPVGVAQSADARLACLNLIHAYNNLADTGQHLLIAGLFTDDAILNANGEVMVGGEAIREGMRKRAAANRKTLHASMNVQFTDDSAEALKAVSTLSVTILTDELKTLSPNLLTRASDEFVRLPGGEWRIHRRTLEIFARRS